MEHLVCKQVIVNDGKIIKSMETEYFVGQQKTQRVMCPTCLEYYTVHFRFEDIGNGYGAWKMTSNPHKH